MTSLRLAVAILFAMLAAACGDNRPAMVATANPLASRAAADIIEAGGSAIDAAIAAQLVLGLVEPQSSGIGGGLFLLLWDQDAGRLTSFDGRETAPMAASEKLFIAADGKPMPWDAASIGGRAVGVPGAVAALWLAHQGHGRLAWKDLFEPAIRLAREGFAVSPRLNEAIALSPRLKNDAAARSLYFTADGQPLPVGAVLKNPAYAATLQAIAEGGRDAFYSGEIAASIVKAVADHNTNPGGMSLADLASYRAVERRPVCAIYRAHRVCGMGPPSSGGLTVLMILKMLEPYHIGAMRPLSPVAMHLFTQASRLAYADRARYMADDDFVAVPTRGLLDEDYLRARARRIDPARDAGVAPAGAPPGAADDKRKAAHAGYVEHGTSHLSIVDRDGNAVTMTTSVERRFGAHIMAAGFVLNNQLTDFSFRPERDGLKVANRVEPGKRPRSSMAPTVIFAPDGDLFALTGSPGGSRIIAYVAQSVIALIDWRMDARSAAALAHVVNRNGPTELEAESPAVSLAAPFRALGHTVKIKALTSGLHIIRKHDGRLDGGADPRREGTVITIGE